MSLIVNPLNLDGWCWGDEEEQEEGEGVETLGLSWDSDVGLTEGDGRLPVCLLRWEEVGLMMVGTLMEPPGEETGRMREEVEEEGREE